MKLTICYITTRRACHSEWFFNSLAREVRETACAWPHVVVVDFYHDGTQKHGLGYRGECINVAPKPTPWQGPHRLTQQNWFAASNARNTGLCHARDSWIAYVDDLSVLLPGWLRCVHEAMANNYIVCGSYQKVLKLAVRSDGIVTNYEEFKQGRDCRLTHCAPDKPMECAGNWLYGCSSAIPIEALLNINGWPEICDGLGCEDCCCGITLSNAGYRLKYDPRMRTFESEEDHHLEPAFRREDWHFSNGRLVKGGNGGTDKSHRALAVAQASKRFDNYCDIRALRKIILKGGKFPEGVNPQHDWYHGLHLATL